MNRFQPHCACTNKSEIRTQIYVCKLQVIDNQPVETINNDHFDDAQPLGPTEAEHKGRVIFDATACPQDIAYPTDLNLLNDAREKLEELVDLVYEPTLHSGKPRTYRKVARKTYLHTAQKKRTGHKVIRKAIREQLNYVRRDIKSIHQLLDAYEGLPFSLKHAEQKYLFVVQTLYEQQKADV